MAETKLRTSFWSVLAAVAVAGTLLSFLPAQRRSEARILQVSLCDFGQQNFTAETSGFGIDTNITNITNITLTCELGSCPPGYSCKSIFTNNTNTSVVADPAGATQGPFVIMVDGCGCFQDLPTLTPTATATATPTATPTDTRIPDGGTCDDPVDCVSGNCVDDVCCDSACDQPGQSCNVAGLEGRCVDSAAAPVASPHGIWGLIALLVVVGGVGLIRMRPRRVP